MPTWLFMIGGCENRLDTRPAGSASLYLTHRRMHARTCRAYFVSIWHIVAPLSLRSPRTRKYTTIYICIDIDRSTTESDSFSSEKLMEFSAKESEVPFSSHSMMISSTRRWWSKDTVAVVTGANKGIGFAFVKRLAKEGVTVILTARDFERGRRAAQELSAQGLHVHFLQLDVSDPSSINTFVSLFRMKFGALDILVNNAAVSFNELNENSVKHAETVIKTNFYGAKLLTQALLPMFRPSPSSSNSSRILNISSRLGSLNKLKNPHIKNILQSENLLEQEIEGVVSLFLEHVKKGTWESQGWPELWTDYAVSKLALNAYTRVLAKRLEGSNIIVNCFCPGFTQTSMTRGKGTHTADDAANVGASLLLLPPDQELPTGKFFLGGSTSSSSSTGVVNSKL